MKKKKGIYINLVNLVLWMIIIVPICWSILIFMKVLLTNNFKASNTVSSIEFTIFMVVWEIILISMWYFSLRLLKNVIINHFKK